MSLDEVVNLQITTQAQSPTRAGFGTPLLVAYHQVTNNLVDIYASLQEMKDAGFAEASPAYRMAQKVFSQNPRPAQVAIGRRATAYTQTIELYPLKTTVGFHYKFEVVDSAGVVTAIDYQVQNGDTVSAICAGLQALLDPVAQMTAAVSPASPNSTKIVLTSTAGKLFNLRALPRPDILKIKDVTADPGIAADLSAIETEDSASWYGAALDCEGKATIVAAAAWLETRRKVYIPVSSDSEVFDPNVTDDVASTLKTAAYVRTDVIMSARELLSYSGAAWLGKMLPTDPGSATWSFKTLAGVSADVLTSGQKTAAANKRANTYTTLGGINITQWGMGPDGSYLDVVIGTDWLYARIQEGIFALMANRPKIPFTDSGVDSVRSVILGILATGVKKGFLASDPAPTVTAPKVKDIDAADKIARVLPDVEFGATLAGAIHKVTVKGVLSV